MKSKLWTLFFVTLAFGCINSETNKIKQIDTKIICNCFLDNLKNDTLSIQVIYNGCEPFFSERTIIYRNHDSLFAELFVFDYDKDVLGTLKSYISDTSRIEYVNFEKAGKTFLNSPDFPPSTIVTSYKIRLDNDSIVFSDTGREFKEYEKMNSEIFGIEKINNFRKKIYR